jgi:hypothetical protein
LKSLFGVRQFITGSPSKKQAGKNVAAARPKKTKGFYG